MDKKHTKVEIKTNGIYSYIYIDGKKLDGVIGYEFKHSLNTIPTLAIELNALNRDICFDGENIEVIKKTKKKVEEN